MQGIEIEGDLSRKPQVAASNGSIVDLHQNFFVKHGQISKYLWVFIK